ncbi:response regulator transcription factor [Sulfitobacter donghicola]|uniref:AraC family transcriptional regulator n=1 Tax=Sulfitobacter donghicola DSW-25 = KCTC 12864 = JCM 14565 TaxID=1300350 RepID=A0A073IUU9_9RHOB|nr:response regulator [Sulfitobacter donghicola]KEJ89162.1 hypothetical protein DSW25_12625 [Sulfitobacter donghicola DSW-25 = KCTC 12864 = JCM 14565]KIN67363.1 Histidine kinase [Sulfitobacter donghicola DSW-25 = KCTC 12864 = JCM 14565]
MERQGKVLIVDDHEDFAMMMSIALSEICIVRTAHSVSAALQKLEEVDFDILILDVNLDDGQGYEIAEIINNDIERNPSIIFMTGLDVNHARQKSLRHRAEDFVTKPFNLPEFCQKIQNKLQNILSLRGIVEEPQIAAIEDKKLFLIGCDGKEFKAKEREFLQKLLEQLQLHCADPKVNVGSVSKGMGFSRRRFQRTLSSVTNESFSTILRRFRTRTADILLGEDYTLKEIARLCGFGSASYFSTSFKREFGLSPRERRHEQRASPD